MWAKSKDSLSVWAIVVISPYILELFRFPIQPHHRWGLYLIGIGAVLNIWLQQVSEIDKIMQVMEAKKVSVDGKFPRLVKGEE